MNPLNRVSAAHIIPLSPNQPLQSDLQMKNQSDSQEQLTAILQLRAMYELTTQITKRCFNNCVSKINPRMEDSESACITNCAANYLKMKILMAQSMVASVHEGKEDILDDQRTAQVK
mgnify:CR=1 FL=1